MSEELNELRLPEYLMVNPELTDDPVNKQGQIGFITAAILNSDEFYVGFDEHEVGFYSADALLRFKPSDQIYNHLKQEAQRLAPKDFRDLKISHCSWITGRRKGSALLWK